MTVTSTVRYQRNTATGEVLLDSQGYPQILADPNANTLAQMRARVTLETQGAITDLIVDDAIRAAIAEYERESFWFNDMRTFGTAGSAAAFNTTQGKEFYSADDLGTLGNWPHIRTLMVEAFANRYPLRERTQAWMDDVSVSQAWNGQPTDWCWVGMSIRIYPIPNMVYPLIVTGTIRFPQLVNDNDTNPWLNEGERLIRCEAKRILFRAITRDADQAQAMELEVMGDPRTGRQGALAMLRRESQRRAGGPGKLRPSRGYL